MSSEYTREFVMKFLQAQFLKCTYQCKPRGGGGGGECGQEVGIWQILKFFDQIPQMGNERSIKSVKIAPTPGEKI